MCVFADVSPFVVEWAGLWSVCVCSCYSGVLTGSDGPPSRAHWGAPHGSCFFLPVFQPPLGSVCPTPVLFFVCRPCLRLLVVCSSGYSGHQRLVVVPPALFFFLAPPVSWWFPALGALSLGAIWLRFGFLGCGLPCCVCVPRWCWPPPSCCRTVFCFLMSCVVLPCALCVVLRRAWLACLPCVVVPHLVVIFCVVSLCLDCCALCRFLLCCASLCRGAPCCFVRRCAACHCAGHVVRCCIAPPLHWLLPFLCSVLCLVVCCRGLVWAVFCGLRCFSLLCCAVLVCGCLVVWCAVKAVRAFTLTWLSLEGSCTRNACPMKHSECLGMGSEPASLSFQEHCRLPGET